MTTTTRTTTSTTSTRPTPVVPLILLLSTIFLPRGNNLSIGLVISFPPLLLPPSSSSRRSRRFVPRGDGGKCRPPSPLAARRDESGVVVVVDDIEDEGDVEKTTTTTTTANDETVKTPISSSTFRVGIIGSGSIALGTACLLSKMGHDPMIWSPSSSSSNAAAAAAAAATIRSTGALECDYDVRIASDPHDLVGENDGVLLLALPANGHRYVMDALAPAIVDRLLPPGHAAPSSSTTTTTISTCRDGANFERDGVGSMVHVIISSHASFGAVYLMKVLREECKRRTRMARRRTYAEDDHDRDRDYDDEGECYDDDDDDERYVEGIMSNLRITAWGTTVVTARRTSDASVRVMSVRRSVDYCTVPSVRTDSDATTTTTTTTTATVVIRDASSSTASADVAGGREDAIDDDATTAIARERALLLGGSDGRDLCAALFGDRFRRRDGGLLAIALSNLNPQNHLGIVLGNMSRMDPPPPLPTVTMDDGSSIPMSSVWPPWYQGENVTPNIGRLMEALDAERLDIARVLGVDVRTIYEHFSWSFGVPMEIPVDDASDEEGRGDEVDENDDDDDGPNDDVESSTMESKTTPRTGRTMSSSSTATTSRTRPLSVSEMNQMMRHRLNNDVLGPVTPDTRYVLEDVPFGLVPTVLLGRLAGRPATLHECGIRILSAMYGRDFMMENDLLAGLGLLSAVTSDDGGDRVHDEIDDIPSLDRWREMAYTGSFRR